MDTLKLVEDPLQIVDDPETLRTEEVGPAVIIKLYVVPIPVQLLTSVTVTTIGNVPAAVGVPLSTPAGDKANPAGKVLPVVKVTGAVPPVCVNVWLKATLTCPFVIAGLLTTGNGFTV